MIASTLIRGGAVVTVDDEGQVLDPGWVLVDNDLSGPAARPTWSWMQRAAL